MRVLRAWRANPDYWREAVRDFSRQLRSYTWDDMARDIVAAIEPEVESIARFHRMSAMKTAVAQSAEASVSNGTTFPATHGSVVIGPRGNLGALDFRELWNRRELLYLLARRDISVRYKQTVLGAAWAILQPVMTMVVFSVLFGKIAKMPSDGVPYPIFAYAGIAAMDFLLQRGD